MPNGEGIALDHLGDVRAFVQVAQARSFTLAAQRLGISRSAVGKCIGRLECGLAARLLQRTTRSVSLTDEGRLFYEHAVRILAEVDEAQAALAWRNEVPRGRLRIDLPVTLGRLHIVPILRRYLSQWPELWAEVSFSDEYSDLVRDGIDLAIRVGGEHDSGLIRRVLAPHRLVTCATPSYLARHGTPATLDDIGRHDTIVYTHAGMATPWRYTVDGRECNLAIEGRWRMNNTEAMRDLALADAGLVQIAAFLVGADLRAGTLVPVLEAFTGPGAPVCAVYPNRRHLSPKVRRLIDEIDRAWADGAPWN